MSYRIDRVLKVVIQMQAPSGVMQNTMHYQYSGSDSRPDGLALQNFGAQLWVDISDEYRAVTPDQIRFESITVTDMSPTNFVQGTYIIPVNTFGLVGGDVTASQVAAVIGWRTARLGPIGRGRIYVPAISESLIANGRFTNTAVTLLSNLASAIHLGGDTSALHVLLVVASRVAQIATVVSNWTTDNVPDTQRRRTPFRGA